jgi:hypothetical protein
MTLKKNNIDKLLAHLSPEERKIALQTLHDLGNNGELYKSLYASDYREIPVGPKEFLDNPDYFNHIGKQAYPIWRQHFLDINTDSNKYYIILTGSIGCGKDFFTYLLLAYEIYKIMCLKDPHKFFARAENRNIVFSLISITKTQTKKVLFEPLKNALDGSPWFQKNAPRNKDKNDVIELRSPADDGTGKYGHITIEYGAPNNASVIGEDVYTAAMDEANFMQVIEKSKKVRGVNKEYNQAKLIHDNILRRMESRFLKNGKLPGKLIVLSSRQYPDDFVETKIKEIRDKDFAYVCEHSFYEVKRKDFSEEEFRVLIGTERYSSRILKDDEEVEDTEAKIISVPMDFYNQFETDIDGAIRDIAGCATLTVRNFLRDRAKVFSCIKPEIENPFSAITTTLDDGHFLLHNIVNKIDKSAIRTVHLDLSSSGDATGFCMAHISGVKEVEHFMEKEDALGKTYIGKVVEQLPVFRIDLALQIIPPKGGEIKYSLIRQLIYDLRDLGFQIQLVTADKYQSKDMLQILSDNGFETGYLSCDTSLEPYYNVRTAIYEGRFEIYDHPVFTNEIINLEEDTKRRKIDHRAGYEKDVSDAISGATWSLTQLGITSNAARVEPSFGTSIVPSREDKRPQEACEDFEKEFVEECALDTLTNDQIKLYTLTNKLTHKQRALLNIDKELLI